MARFQSRFIIIILVISQVPLIAVVFAELRLGISLPHLTRDMSATTGVHPLTGALSNLGILLWWSSATLWFFSALYYYELKVWRLFRFTLSFALLSTYLALDDLFMFHEFLAPNYLGISENTVYKMLIIVTGFILIAFRKMIMYRDGFILLFALGFLGSSAVVDLISAPWFDQLGHWIYLLEDGLKWLGIYCWFCFSLVRGKLYMLSRSTAFSSPTSTLEQY